MSPCSGCAVEYPKLKGHSCTDCKNKMKAINTSDIKVQQLLLHPGGVVCVDCSARGLPPPGGEVDYRCAGCRAPAPAPPTSTAFTPRAPPAFADRMHTLIPDEPEGRSSPTIKANSTQAEIDAIKALQKKKRLETKGLPNNPDVIPKFAFRLPGAKHSETLASPMTALTGNWYSSLNDTVEDVVASIRTRWIAEKMESKTKMVWDDCELTFGLDDKNGKIMTIDLNLPTYTEDYPTLLLLFKGLFQPDAPNGKFGLSSTVKVGQINIHVALNAPWVQPKTKNKKTGKSGKRAERHSASSDDSDTAEKPITKAAKPTPSPAAGACASTNGSRDSSSKWVQLRPSTQLPVFNKKQFGRRVIATCDRSGNIGFACHNEDEVVYVADPKVSAPITSGSFRAVSKLQMASHPGLWIAKQYSNDWACSVKLIAPDQDGNVPMLNANIQFDLNARDMVATAMAVDSAESFRSKVWDLPGCGSTDFHVAPSFMIVIGGPKKDTSASYIVEEHLEHLDLPGYKFLSETKLFGAHYQPSSAVIAKQLAFGLVPDALADLLMRIDAWLHFFWQITSQRTAVLADLQGFLYKSEELLDDNWMYQFIINDLLQHSLTRNAVAGDGGYTAILEFLTQHTCNHYCDALDLSPTEDDIATLPTPVVAPEDVAYWRKNEHSEQSWDNHESIAPSHQARRTKYWAMPDDPPARMEMSFRDIGKVPRVMLGRPVV